MTYEELKQQEPFFGHWYLGDLLGRGSFGDVYEITRTEVNGEVYHAALKVISFPRDRRELEEVSLSQGSEASAFAYYEDMRNGFLSEISMMENFKGRTNIVSYEDHNVVPRGGNEPGYDIFIRMELLTDLKTVILRDHGKLCQNETEVAKIGIDICEALKLCHGQNPPIIHRDIKPGNIFVTDDGTYKLGDFGIARRMDDSEMQMSMKGTYEYMAPEVYRRSSYDQRADIYSLGMVLYRIMNGTREAFIPTTEKVITTTLKETALMRRMRGDPLDNPVYASEEFSAVLKKACAFRKEDRYRDVYAFQNDLLAVYRGETPEAMFDEDKTMVFQENTPRETPDRDTDFDDNFDYSKYEKENNEQKKGGKKLLILIPVVLLIVAAGAAFFLMRGRLSGSKPTNEPPVVTSNQGSNQEDQQETTVARLGSESTDQETNDAASASKPAENTSAENGSTDAEEPSEPAEPEIVTPVLDGELAVYGNREEADRAIYVGDAADSLVFDGTVKASEESDEVVDGFFMITSAEFIEAPGEYQWTFYPDDTDRYESIEGTVSVDAIVPAVEPYMAEKVRLYGKRREDVSNRLIFKGDAVADMTFTGAFQASEEDSTEVTGTYALVDVDVIEESGTYEWEFTPDDTEHYLPVRGTVNVTAMIYDTVTGAAAVKAVENKKELYSVDISGEKLKTLNILKGATNLRVLDASNNNLTDITALDECTRIEFLSLYGNEKLKDVDVLLNKWYLIGVSLSDTAVPEKTQNKIYDICGLTTKERNAKAKGE